VSELGATRIIVAGGAGVVNTNTLL
jgi:hypothetical protein